MPWCVYMHRNAHADRGQGYWMALEMSAWETPDVLLELELWSSEGAAHVLNH